MEILEMLSFLPSIDWRNPNILVYIVLWLGYYSTSHSHYELLLGLKIGIELLINISKQLLKKHVRRYIFWLNLLWTFSFILCVFFNIFVFEVIAISIYHLSIRKKLNITFLTMQAGTDHAAKNKREIASPFILRSNIVQDC